MLTKASLLRPIDDYNPAKENVRTLLNNFVYMPEDNQVLILFDLMTGNLSNSFLNYVVSVSQAFTEMNPVVDLKCRP